jgi:hypothetical protein
MRAIAHVATALLALTTVVQAADRVKLGLFSELSGPRRAEGR